MFPFQKNKINIEKKEQKKSKKNFKKILFWFNLLIFIA